MFEIGEYIVYGNTGVCKVAEKTKMAAPGAKTDKLYYTLEPVYVPNASRFDKKRSGRIDR